MAFNPLSDEIKKYLLSRGERLDAGNQFFPDARTVAQVEEEGLAENPTALEVAQRPIRNLTAEDTIPFSQKVPAYVSEETNKKTDALLTAAEERLGMLPEEVSEPDVPTAQAQAEMPNKQIPHTEDVSKDLKADDNAKKEQLIADENLRSTDPIAYIRRKMQAEEEELRKAQREADVSRNLENMAGSMTRAGYLWSNVDMPEQLQKNFAQRAKEANIPVERLAERRQATGEKAKLLQDMMDRQLDQETLKATREQTSAYHQAQLELEKQRLADSKAGREQTQEYRDAMLELQRQKLAREGQKKNEKPSVGESQSDKEFAKHYSTWVAEKGSLSADKSLANLDASINEMKNLEKKGITGGLGGAFYSVMPESLKSAVNEKIGRIDSNLRSAVVDTLRPLLGAQFAAVEGERIMKQTFDPNQPMSENIRRAELVLGDLKNQVESRKRAVKYWESKGQTLKGYEAFPEQAKEKAAPGASVTIRRKSDGAKKTLPAEKAQKYLSDPNFEEVK